MIAGVVVGFFPDFQVLDDLLLKLLKQVDYLIFVDNGGGGAFLRNFPTERSKVEYLDLDGNQGLGYALNEGFKLAVARGCQYVATFDQDSSPPDQMIAGLLTAHNELARQGINCAAVAPIFYDSREGEKVRFPFYQEVEGVICAVPKQAETSDVIEVDVLITSGMLVKTEVWSQGVQYNAGLFVDYTDTDWCFRARAAGFKLFACLDQEMAHAPSDAPPARIFGLSFFRYSPLRRYYYFRNTVFFIGQKYVPMAWKKRLALGLVARFFVNFLIDEKRFSALKMMGLGILDGLSGKAGAYKQA
jgi:rhamnosyltransferase